MSSRSLRDERQNAQPGWQTTKTSANTALVNTIEICNYVPIIHLIFHTILYMSYIHISTIKGSAARALKVTAGSRQVPARRQELRGANMELLLRRMVN